MHMTAVRARIAGLRAGIAALMLGVAMLMTLATAPARAEAGSWPEDQPGATLEIALVTIGPGRIYWQRFGHNAILVRDRADGSERLYNYGLFDFAEDDFLVNFARGHMTYAMAGGPPGPELAAYRDEGREITVQVLNLAPAQRLALRDFLEWNRRPENAKYRYDYFRANCSTKVRDAIDTAIGGALRRATDNRSRGYTLRMHSQRLAAPDLPIALGIHAGLGAGTDLPVSFWDEMFVPMEVMRHVRAVTVTDGTGRSVPLVASERRLAEAAFAQPGELPPSWLWPMLGVGLLLALLLHYGLRARSAALRVPAAALLAALWTLAGVGGVVLVLLMTATEHSAAWHNRNVLLFSPLCLALLPAAWGLARGRAVWPRASLFVARAVLVGAVLAWLWLVLPGAQQAMLDWIALWLPVHAAAALALARMAAPANAAR
jgi:hypothetical protein